MLLKIDFVEVSRTCCDMYISESVSVLGRVFKESFKRVLRSGCVPCCVPNLVKWLCAVLCAEPCEVAVCRVRRVCLTLQ